MVWVKLTISSDSPKLAYPPNPRIFALAPFLHHPHIYHLESSVEFLTEYGLFLAKSLTVVVSFLFIVAIAANAANTRRHPDQKELLVEKLNDKLTDTRHLIEEHVLDKDELKQLRKEEKKQEKERDKKEKSGNEAAATVPRVYVLDFDGDIKASALETFREAVTAVLQIAKPEHDEIVVKIESPGDMVHSYGLAAAQLDRIKKKGFTLTVCVDKVAASGGYMMACVADRIIASPFAILGSIGVVAQIPNFHRLLKKNDVDVEILTAGEHKRTLTMFGQNTDKAREKFVQDLEDTHELFKHYVAERRPVVDIEKVANGDIWFGTRAKEVALADELMTSDEYLCEACNRADVYSVEVKEKKTIADKLGIAASRGIEQAVTRLLSMWNVTRGM